MDYLAPSPPNWTWTIDIDYAASVGAHLILNADRFSSGGRD
jgi:hypothetical protein